jgi:hypothetical protein
MEQRWGRARTWEQVFLEGITLIVIRVAEERAAKGNEVVYVIDSGAVNVGKLHDKILATEAVDLNRMVG